VYLVPASVDRISEICWRFSLNRSTELYKTDYRTPWIGRPFALESGDLFAWIGRQNYTNRATVLPESVDLFPLNRATVFLESVDIIIQIGLPYSLNRSTELSKFFDRLPWLGRPNYTYLSIVHHDWVDRIINFVRTYTKNGSTELIKCVDRLP